MIVEGMVGTAPQIDGNSFSECRPAGGNGGPYRIAGSSDNLRRPGQTDPPYFSACQPTFEKPSNVPRVVGAEDRFHGSRLRHSQVNERISQIFGYPLPEQFILAYGKVVFLR